jgi:hypothetical protein
VGRKASGPVMMGSGVARQIYNQTLKPILSLREWAFFVSDTWIATNLALVGRKDFFEKAYSAYFINFKNITYYKYELLE